MTGQAHAPLEKLVFTAAGAFRFMATHLCPTVLYRGADQEPQKVAK